MPARSATAVPHRDIHAEIATTPIAQIEAIPGEPIMPWRRAHVALNGAHQCAD